MLAPSAPGAAILAAAITPLAAGDDALYLALATALTFLVGVMCMAASLMRLGALADFLSRPILIGFMNGVGLSIVFGQLHTLCLGALSALGPPCWPSRAQLPLALSDAASPVRQPALYAFPSSCRASPRAPLSARLSDCCGGLLGLERKGRRQSAACGGLPAWLPLSGARNPGPFFAEAACCTVIFSGSMVPLHVGSPRGTATTSTRTGTRCSRRTTSRPPSPSLRVGGSVSRTPRARPRARALRLPDWLPRATVATGCSTLPAHCATFPWRHWPSIVPARLRFRLEARAASAASTVRVLAVRLATGGVVLSPPGTPILLVVALAILPLSARSRPKS